MAAFLASKPEAWDGLLRFSIGDPTPSEKFRHAGWWPIRKRVIASLYRTAQSDSRIRSFCTCGRASFIERSDIDPTRFRIRTNHCGDRLCTPCANTRSLRIRDALLWQMGKRPCKFITLTLCGKGEPLTDLLDRLYRSFKALRNHPTWADRVDGGAALLEIKWSEKAKRWHPHLHVICEGSYVPQHELSDAWRSITKDSFIVDIQQVRNPEIAGKYVSKYASKPLETSFCMRPELLDEALVALKGRRLCMCFGTWYGTALSNAEDLELADDMIDVGTWSRYCDLDELLADFRNGGVEARAILAALRCDGRAIMASELDTT